jgi:hypothetical protein
MPVEYGEDTESLHRVHTINEQSTLEPKPDVSTLFRTKNLISF